MGNQGRMPCKRMQKAAGRVELLDSQVCPWRGSERCRDRASQGLAMGLVHEKWGRLLRSLRTDLWLQVLPNDEPALRPSGYCCGGLLREGESEFAGPALSV